MTEHIKPPCINGCTAPRQHAKDCDDKDECRGCAPRPVRADGLYLCEPCHLRLSGSLADVAPQHRLLIDAATPSQQMNIRPQPKHGRPDYNPIESAAPRYMYVTGTGTSSPQEGEPVRIACHDTAQALSDLLSEWVERVCDHYAASGPQRLRTTAERAGHMRMVYRPANLYRDEAVYVWTDPPVRFEVTTAVRWLRGNLERLERMEAIGDMMEDLRQLMGEAHNLCPWRLPAKRLPAIPCPECHAPTLMQYGGRDTVTCTNERCKTEIPENRYLIWARIYEEETA